MYCQSCGKEIEQGNSFCSNCGSKVINSNEVSNNSNPPFQDIPALPPQGISQSPIQSMPELPLYAAPNNVLINPKKEKQGMDSHYYRSRNIFTASYNSRNII